MGCVSEKEKRAAAVEEGKEAKGEAQAAAGKTAAAPALVKKLTPQEIAKKREDMRYNLLEGHSQPPAFTAPHFGSVTTFDTHE